MLAAICFLAHFNRVSMAVAADMQITTLVFTQDNTNRDTLTVDITLEHAPRSRITELIAGGLDLAVGVASPILSSTVPAFAAL